MTHTLTARRLITDIGTIEFPVLTITDGLLADISSDPTITDTSTLTAAFLDIHTHGAIGHDVMSATPSGLAELQRFLATKGVAHYLPTTVTASIDDTLRALESLADLIESPRADNEATPIGIHLEGPFLSHAKPGVHPIALLQPPSIELFDRFHTAARGHIKLLTIAPEPNAIPPSAKPSESCTPLETPPQLRYTEASASGLIAAQKSGGALAPEGNSALDLIRHATSLNVRCSLGHSNALASETLAAIAAGATSATHTFNAMRPLDHREPGILGTVLTSDSLFAELICDGIHVHPNLVQLWLRAKGPSSGKDRAILVTDSMSATGMPDGNYTLAGLPVLVANGKAVLADHRDTLAGSILTPPRETLAGSVLTLDRAVANLQAFTGADLATATRLASHNPAAMLHLPTLTRIAPGSTANLNRFDASGHLIATYLRGHQLPS
jgi:N-acetylglucosamine-6-phosphate deacetylase